MTIQALRLHIVDCNPSVGRCEAASPEAKRSCPMLSSPRAMTLEVVGSTSQSLLPAFKAQTKSRRPELGKPCAALEMAGMSWDLELQSKNYLISQETPNFVEKTGACDHAI